MTIENNEIIINIELLFNDFTELNPRKMDKNFYENNFKYIETIKNWRKADKPYLQDGDFYFSFINNKDFIYNLFKPYLVGYIFISTDDSEIKFYDFNTLKKILNIVSNEKSYKIPLKIENDNYMVDDVKYNNFKLNIKKTNELIYNILLDLNSNETIITLRYVYTILFLLKEYSKFLTFEVFMELLKILNVNDHFLSLLNKSKNDHNIKLETCFSKQIVQAIMYLLDNFISEEFIKIAEVDIPSPENIRISKGNSIIKGILYLAEKKDYEQLICIGNIGTGKSNYIANKTKDLIYKRVIFTPGMTKNNFIGYTNNSNDKFISNIFMDFYIEALNDFIRYINGKDLSLKKHVLIIEEMNRGNVLQIFDFVSNLLDRENGFSCYPINIDNSLRKFFKKNIAFKEFLNASYIYKDFLKVHNDKEITKIALLPNMSIYASMNVDDNTIYDLDFMLLRRFNVKFFAPVTEGNEIYYQNRVNDSVGSDFTKLLKLINKKIFKITKDNSKVISLYFFNSHDKIQINGKNLIIYDSLKNKLLYHIFFNCLYTISEDEYNNNVISFFNNDNFYELLLIDDVNQLFGEKHD